MAIAQIVNKDTAARTKLNAVIDEVNAAAVATQTDVNTGTDNEKRITPLTLETRRINRRANQTMVNQGLDNDQWVSSLTLEGKFTVKVASTAEVNAGAAVTKYVAPDVMEARRQNRKASQTEVNQGTEGDKWIAPDTLQGKVDAITVAYAAAIAAEATARNVAIAGAVAAEATVRDVAIANAVDVSIKRPGANPDRYTNNVVGGTVGTVDGTTTANTRGTVRRLTGDMRITSRERIPVLSGLAWRGKVHLSRAVDPTDPSGDNVRVQLLWLNSAGTLRSSQLVYPANGSVPLFVADGPQVAEFTFGSADSQYPTPAGATDAIVSVRTYGLDGQTDVEVIHVEPGEGAISLARVKALETATVGFLSVDPVTVELGSAASPTLAWSIEGNAAVASQEINPGAVALAANVREWTAPSPITNDRAYTLTVTDKEGRETEASIAVDFRHRMWWGVSAADALDEAGVLALANTDLITSISRVVYLGPADQYLYVAYPQTPYGAPKCVNIFGFDETANVETDLVSVTTPGGLTVNYRVIRSPFKLAGSNIKLEVVA